MKKLFILILLIIGLAAGFQYLYCPVYIFPQPQPFSGDKLYNPYAGMDSSFWRKANFHLHTRQWGGVTNGSATSAKDADSVYRLLHYDIIGISDYQSINSYREKEKSFIPEYEHGYMLPKNHQIVLGARKVIWLDYPFPQSLNNKQHIIDVLKEDTGVVVALAHPEMRNSYPINDFNFLSNYDCIEVFDRIVYSLPQWDAALSSGHPAFATSVDDNHNINDISEVASNFTLVNCSEPTEPSVLRALKAGRMIACDMYNQRKHDFAKKLTVVLSLPIINNIAVENNQLKINADRPMKAVEFIGQGGIINKTLADVKEASYDFKPEDSYIRTDIHFADSTIYHLNPVFRYSGNEWHKPKAIVNETRTIINRIVFFIIIAVFILLTGSKVANYKP